MPKPSSGWDEYLSNKPRNTSERVTAVKLRKAKRGLALLLSGVIGLAMAGMPLSALASDSDETQTNTGAQAILEAASGNQNDENAYSRYLERYASEPLADAEQRVIVDREVSASPVTVELDIPQGAGGLYTLNMLYKATDDGIDDMELSLQVDGALPFTEAGKLKLPRIWVDEDSSRTDTNGNEFAAKQIAYDGYYCSPLTDIVQNTAEPYRVYLSAGRHTVTVAAATGTFALQALVLGAPEQPAAYQKPDKATGKNTESYIIEGERAQLKNRYWLGAKTDNSSARISPHSATRSLVNYIGGGSWKAIGETIVWETPEVAEGYYQIGFSFRQNTVMGGKTYRALTIDGETPFAEAQQIGFMYDDNWQSSFWADDAGTPYLVYLSAGKHQLALTVVPGEMQGPRDLLQKAVEELSSLYIDINMITGETPDTYRDYELFEQLPNMENQLNSIRELLKQADEEIKAITGKESGSQSSVVKSMIQVIEQMLDNRYTAHRYKSLYYDKYCAVASVLNDMKSMPLDLDKISLTPAGSDEPFESQPAFTQFGFSVQRFFYSFVRDYASVTDAAENSLTLWVNWGRDQAQVLNQLIKSSYTQETGIAVDVQLVNASIVQAILSGKGPDCVLQQSRSEPVNLAMRGVLYDLSQFDDVDEVLSRFHKDADIPYRYQGGLYALPDTQDFFMMFYRKDILQQLGLSVPNTWDEFVDVCNRLARYNMKVWLPNSAATNLGQTSIGIGSINIFPSLMLQNGVSIYTEDGRSTSLTTPESLAVFNQWTDYYTKLKLSRTMDFYNRFRIGTCPIGISSYTMYTTLKATAPEIDGLWSMAQIPGTVQEDGTVSHISAGGGSACAMLKATKNPQAAWDFLKWWTRSDTQLSFSNEIESLLGAAGRVAVSNMDAFRKMSWDADMYEAIEQAWDQVEEIPEYPGSYYVSRSVYQSFWNVVADNRNTKDTLLKYGKQADAEIQRKWNQYENRFEQ